MVTLATNGLVKVSSILAAVDLFEGYTEGEIYNKLATVLDTYKNMVSNDHVNVLTLLLVGNL